jgi:hypothetical protein
MKTWEYKTIKVGMNAMMVNEMGKDGWELISAIPDPQSSSINYLFYTFKRELQTDDLEAQIKKIKKETGL